MALSRFEGLDYPNTDYSRDLGALSIANGYLHGQDVMETVQRLETRGSFGNLLAGEILLDHASQDRESASNWLYHAKRKYKIAANAHPSEPYDYYIVNSAQAHIRLSQLVSYETIFLKDRMPTERTSMDRYKNLAWLASSIYETHKDYRGIECETGISLGGILSETAVHLLAQRTALKHLGAESWLPLQSMFSEDHGGDCLAITDTPAWDLNIFTAYPGSPINATYNLQIKSSKKDGIYDKAATLYVSPDLEVTPGERFIAEKIIAGCNFELSYPERSERVSEELDIRTTKLLDLLG